MAITSLRPASRCSSISGKANGWIIAANVPAAAAPASRIAARGRPRAKVAAWRASAIDGNVSPIVLNML